MPIGKDLDVHDTFRLAMGNYYKSERDRTERCLADIIDILGNSEMEHKQIEMVCERLTKHYDRASS